MVCYGRSFDNLEYWFEFVEEKRFQITLVCREWGIVKVFYRFRRPEGYIQLNGPGEFFQKNCKMICPYNSVLFQKYWNQIGTTTTPYFKGDRERKFPFPWHLSNTRPYRFSKTMRSFIPTSKNHDPDRPLCKLQTYRKTRSTN